LNSTFDSGSAAEHWHQQGPAVVCRQHDKPSSGRAMSIFRRSARSAATRVATMPEHLTVSFAHDSHAAQEHPQCGNCPNQGTLSRQQPATGLPARSVENPAQR
jgi:hypothetical protein